MLSPGSDLQLHTGVIPVVRGRNKVDEKQQNVFYKSCVEFHVSQRKLEECTVPLKEAELYKLYNLLPHSETVSSRC